MGKHNILHPPRKDYWKKECARLRAERDDAVGQASALSADLEKVQTENDRYWTRLNEAVGLLREAAFSRIANEHDMLLASEMVKNGWQWPEHIESVHCTTHELVAFLAKREGN